jgi:hypothetical protein
MKIVFYAPHAGIWVHAFPEALVAEALAQSGHQIVYVTCDRQFSGYCNPMMARRLSYDSPQEKKFATCRNCMDSASRIKQSFGLQGTTIGSCLESQDQREIEAILGKVNRDNFLDLQVDGIPVGRMATYELLLNRKKRSLDFSEPEWAEYEILLGNALRSLFASRRLLDREKPDRVIAYNTLYAVNHVACKLAESRGIPSYFLHAGGNLSRRMETLLFGRRDGVQFYDHLLAFWPSERQTPCMESSIASVTDHFLELLRGRNVYAYSSPKARGKIDLVSRFEIPAGAKVLVATMSSPDERFAAKVIDVMSDGSGKVFADQVEWIRVLCAWLRTRPDLFLVVRVHPREFPNKRERVTSEHARELAEVLGKMPPNVRVNWPDDQVSLYDLAGIADVFLNAWSAAGKEMSLLGLPVVVYAPELLVYPPDLNYAAQTREQYFELIDQALADGWRAERMRIAFRWCALEYEKATIDIRESFPKNVSGLTGQIVNLVERFGMRAMPALWRQLDCIRRARRLRTAPILDAVLTRKMDTPLELIARGGQSTSLEEETLAIRRQAGRLAKALYGVAGGHVPADRLHRQLVNFASGT